MGAINRENWFKGWAEVEHPTEKGRTILQNNLDINCYGCGKPGRIVAFFRQSKQREGADPRAVKVPQSTQAEFIIPEGWVQVIRLTNRHYPGEVLTAIYLGEDPHNAFNIWYGEVSMHFGEYACCEECYHETCRKLYDEYKTLKQALDKVS